MGYMGLRRIFFWDFKDVLWDLRDENREMIG